MNQDRLPPHSPDGETSILSCAFQCPSQALCRCRERLESGSDVFYDPRNRLIYEAMISVDDSGKAVDIVTVQEFLKASGKLEQVGGVTALLEIQDSVCSVSNLKYYIDIVQEKYLLRKAISTCTEIVADAYNYEGEVEAMLDNMERKIMAIRPSRSTETATVKQLVSQSIQSMEESLAKQGVTDGLLTGFCDLDRMCGGLKPGEMTVIAGFPGSGKTSFAMNIGENALLKHQRKVGVFSLEMDAVSLVTRFICSHARVNLRNVRDGFLVDRDFPKITRAGLSIANSAIWFEDESDLSIHQLRAKARRLSQQHGIQLLIVDYLQLLSAVGGPRKVENRQQEVADISRGIKALSRELRIPVIALSQLNDDGRLRESRAIGQDADNVWILQPKSELVGTNGEAEPVDLVIAKARNGPRGKVHLTFLKPYTRFESAAKIEPKDTEYAKPYND